MEMEGKTARPRSRVGLAVFIAMLGVVGGSALVYRHFERAKAEAEFCARSNLDSAHCAARMEENRRSWER